MSCAGFGIVVSGEDYGLRPGVDIRARSPARALAAYSASSWARAQTIVVTRWTAARARKTTGSMSSRAAP